MASQKKVSFAEPTISQSTSYSLRPPPRRPSTTPFTRSPLRANMSAASASPDSESGSSTHDSPTRPSRSTEQTQQTRPRRSSSVPATLHVPTESNDSSRATSPTFAGNRRSVKHLTCYWWKSKAPCRYSDDECLYAHRDTGKYADPPRSLVPGEPAKAGRSLQQAMNDLGHPSNQSCTSVFSLPRSGATTPGLEMPLIQRASANIQLGRNRIQTAPANIQAPLYNHADDNAYLRKMLNEAGHEKKFFFSTIDSLNVDKDNLQSDKVNLQSDKTALQTTIDRLRVEKDQVTQERDILRSVVHQLQQQLQQRSTSNQYGATGTHRSNSRGSWVGFNSSGLSRPPSAHSEREQEGDYSVIRNLGPNI